MTPTPMESLISSLSTGFSSVVTDTLSAIGTIAPIALPILGAIIVIAVGIKVFKQVAHK